MTRFDRIAVVDWSASNAPPRNRPQADAIWIGVASARGTVTSYHPSRHLAEVAITHLIEDSLALGERLLVGFDFPMGYPDGFAARLTGVATAAAVWAWLNEHITDGSDNRNNRFAVANQINQWFASCETSSGTSSVPFSGQPKPTTAGTGTNLTAAHTAGTNMDLPSKTTPLQTTSGPFWGRPESQPFPYLPTRKNVNYAALGLSERRRVEQIVPRAQPVWKLYTTGAAGGQSLTGLPLIHRLSQRPGVSVWPFQPYAQVTLAEVYPSLLAPAVTAALKYRDTHPAPTVAAARVPSTFNEVLLASTAAPTATPSKDGLSGTTVIPVTIKDEVQVRLLASALWNLTQTGALGPMLADPPPEARGEEGWILGAGHAAALLAAL